MMISAEATLCENLNNSLQKAYQLLKNFAKSTDYLEQMRVAFGDNFNLARSQDLANQWKQDFFESFPPIELRNSAEINGANGAFAAATNTIYLSQEFLENNENNSQAIAAVLLEEIGHYVDTQINAWETEGDEGAIFSALVRGEKLTEEQLEELRAEDDSAVITLDGKTILIEQSTITGTSGNDTLNGTPDNDIFYPGLGTDRLDGLEGIDLLAINYASQTTGIYTYHQTADGSAGYVDSAYPNRVNYVNIERFHITGTGFNDDLKGGNFGDTLIGGGGNDTFTCRGGVDYIDGGTGIDELIDADFSSHVGALTVTNSGATITLSNGTKVSGIEQFRSLTMGSGNDTVNLTLTAAAPVDTTLNGGAGVDLLRLDFSQATNDLYTYQSNADGSSGYIAANSPNRVDYTNVERFHIIGTGYNDDIEGGSFGDTLIGGGGDDTFKRGSGVDYIEGGAGIDELIDGDFSSHVGALTVTNSGATITLSNGTKVSGIEKFRTLTMGSGNDTVNLTVTAAAPVDTTLNGGAGVDLLRLDFSQATTDVYTYQSTADGSSGYIYANYPNRVDYTNVERFHITGTGYNDDIEGGSSGDTLIGGGGDDTFKRGSGVDYIEGGAGIDELIDADFSSHVGALTVTNSGATITLSNGTKVTGIEKFRNLTMGGGNDTVNLTVTAAVPVDTTLNGGAGIDLLRLNLSQATSGVYTYHSNADGSSGYIAANYPNRVDYSNVERFHVNGTIYDDQLKGGSSADTLNGDAGNDSIQGGNGNNILSGGIGNDTLVGGTGSDILHGGPGSDSMVGGAGDDFYYVDTNTDVVLEAIGGGIDTVYSTITRTLGDHQENLTLIGPNKINGTGNALNNRLVGNAANNYLSAGVGNDTLVGNGGNDTLVGGTGTDSMVGGLGNDLYNVDSGADIIVEAAGGGIDTVISTVSRTLGVEQENLSLGGTAAISGSGNTLANRMIGNAANNNLVGNAGNDTLVGNGGNDTLVGGTGTDSMVGGLGNDLYNVDSGADIIVEAAGGGIDTIISTVSRTLGAEQENLTLGGTAAISGFGNTLANRMIGNAANNNLVGNAGNDTLVGNGGNDTLVGGTGTDSMVGGLGNDLYNVDSGADIIVEAAGGGIDTIISTVSRTLGAEQENLTLGGTAAISGFGNTLANRIIGNAASNYLAGGAGNDTIFGGDGNDTLVGAAGVDSLIAGVGNDLLYLGVDSDRDRFVYSAGHGSDTIYQFLRGATGDLMTFAGISAIDVVTVGGNTQFRQSDGVTGNAGFGTGGLLVTMIGTTGFSSANIGTNVAPTNTANFLFS